MSPTVSRDGFREKFLPLTVYKTRAIQPVASGCTDHATFTPFPFLCGLKQKATFLQKEYHMINYDEG